MEARIIGTGSYLPGEPVDNDTLERRVSGFDREKAHGLSFSQWAEQVTGIKTRYFSGNESAEEMAFKASQLALDSAGIEAKDLDFIVFGTFTQEKDIPNPACTLAYKLGLDIGAFPENTACSEFVYGLGIAHAFIKAGYYKNVLVVASERLSKIMDFSDPKTAVLFGDGAGAAVVQESDRIGMYKAFLSSDYSYHINLDNADTQEPFEKTFLTMPGGPQVLKRAIDGMAEAAFRALKNSPYTINDIDYVIPHQANERITKGLIKRLNLPEEKFCRTIYQYGNTSGASVAIALDKALRGELDYKVKGGDKVLLTAIGGGYTLGAIVLEF